MTDPVMWGIHAGKTGYADFVFKSKRVIALVQQPAEALSTR